MTALNIAAIKSSVEIICLLIGAGADWNIKSNFDSGTDYDFVELLDESIMKNIINKYPEKYQDYLKKKTINKFKI